MPLGTHVHDWKYGEPKRIYFLNEISQYEVIRFCKQCLFVEEIRLYGDTGIPPIKIEIIKKKNK